MKPPRHLDNGFGVPVCPAPSRGSLLVDEPAHVTCPTCLLRLGELLRARRSGAV